MEHKDITEFIEEEKEFRKFEHQLKYIKKLMRRILYDIEQNQPFLQIDIYAFCRYLVQHCSKEIKYNFKKILPYAEQFYNDMTNIDVMNEIVNWAKSHSLKLINGRLYVISIIENKVSDIEEKLEEEKINHYMKMVSSYLKEHKVVSYLQLKQYMINNRMFMPEDVLLKELKRLEENGIIEIQYTLKENGNIPLLIKVKES